MLGEAAIFGRIIRCRRGHEAEIGVLRKHSRLLALGCRISIARYIKRTRNRHAVHAP
jgi:hypothetical protein